MCVCMLGIGSHTICSIELNFGTEALSHLQIAQPNFQLRTPPLGSEPLITGSGRVVCRATPGNSAS